MRLFFTIHKLDIRYVINGSNPMPIIPLTEYLNIFSHQIIFFIRLTYKLNFEAQTTR